jgi:hypothetical protein
MNVVFFGILLAMTVLLIGFMYQNVHAVDLKVLESHLNKNSITGVIQNPYNFTVGGITVRAEFYDKEDGHLVGLRNFGHVSEEKLKPDEKSSYKIYEEAGETGQFPKTDFTVIAEGSDYTNAKPIDIEEYADSVTRALKSIPTEIVTTITTYDNGTKEIGNKTVTYDNGTKEIINKTGTYKITSDDNH